MTNDVVTIGEGGVRLSPTGEAVLDRARQLDMHVVGTEANVVSGLASCERNVGWVSAVSDSLLGRAVESRIRTRGVDTSRVSWVKDARVGIYFVTRGETPNERSIHYDRTDTAFSLMNPDQVDWDYLLDTRVLHLTGLSLALSPSVREIIREAAELARSSGVLVSFDVNYRPQLWSATEAMTALIPLLQSTDLLFCAERDARTVFGLNGHQSEVLEALGALTTAESIVMSAGPEGVYALTGGGELFQPALPVDVVDRPGAGDALAAGVLHGVLDGDLRRGLMYGVVLAAAVLSQRGEHVDIGVHELDRRVERHLAAHELNDATRNDMPRREGPD